MIPKVLLRSRRNDFVPSKNDFFRKFNWIYCEEKLKLKVQQNMMIALAEAYIAKLTSCHNPFVHTKVMNLCLVIHVKSLKTYKLIAANMPLLWNVIYVVSAPRIRSSQL